MSDMRERACNPDSSAEELSQAVRFYPELVLANPALSLLILEDPGLIRLHWEARAVLYWYQRLWRGLSLYQPVMLWGGDEYGSVEAAMRPLGLALMFDNAEWVSLARNYESLCVTGRRVEENKGWPAAVERELFPTPVTLSHETVLPVELQLEINPRAGIERCEW